jgi:16S rRNA (cytidine1402-2'-O)-methyltransferase
MSGTLYLVAPPIGNLGDFSPRAVETLESVDFIAAEDTRVSVKLLNHFEIKKPLISYHEHNYVSAGQSILNRLLSGESCALVTDAGTPAVSDPGEDLVRLCAENDVPVTSIPGCSAVVNALALSALPTGRFCFEGFLSTNKNERSARLEEIKNDRRTTVFYEAPHKLKKTLDDIMSVFGDRKIALCRELTKLNEEIIRTTLSAAISYYEKNEPRGEYVLVIEGASEAQIKEESFFANMSIEEHFEYYIAMGMSKMDATKAVAKDRGVAKSVIYKEINK